MFKERLKRVFVSFFYSKLCENWLLTIILTVISNTPKNNSLSAMFPKGAILDTRDAS